MISSIHPRSTRKTALVTIRDIIYIPGMGRKQINQEQTPARLPAGTLNRIDAVLGDDENRADFIRSSIERELKRREKRVRSVM
jgi:hypothetical protein